MEVYIESMSLLISNDHVNFKVAFDASWGTLQTESQGI